MTDRMIRIWNEQDREQIEGCMVQARLGRSWGDPDRTRNNVAVARAVNRQLVRRMRAIKAEQASKQD